MYKVPDHICKLYEYVGVIHIHSSYSDGTKSIPDIAKIAIEAGLDYLLFADHMTLKPLELGFEGWYGPVLVLIGYEINDSSNRNHYLAFNVDRVLSQNMDAKGYVAEVRRAGGIGFIAHPDEKRTAFPEHPPYPWLEWDTDQFDGIEIWNHSSEWAERLTRKNMIRHYMHPRRDLTGPEKVTLDRWDKLNLYRRVVGIGGSDVHAFRYKFGPLVVEIFPYKVQLRAIRTHILLESPLSGSLSVDKRSVYSALVKARCFVSNFRWGDASGFRFWAKYGEDIYNMGDRSPMPRYVDFHVKTPLEGEIELLRNGEPVYTACGRELFFSTDLHGAYRVEVRRSGKIWLLSNHIVFLDR